MLSMTKLRSGSEEKNIWEEEMSLYLAAPEQTLFEDQKHSKYREYIYILFLYINKKMPSNETITKLLTLLMETCLRKTGSNAHFMGQEMSGSEQLARIN